MKQFTVLTAFPGLIDAIAANGVLAQAQKKQIIKILTCNPRDFASDVHKSIDDRPYGGGDGMVMLADILEKALLSFPERGPVIYLSPQGKKFDDQMAQDFSKKNNIVLICGRYSGVDYRFTRQYVDMEISVGDYVLSGGELAAGAIIDATARFIPGVLGHEESAFQDSITQGYLEAPQFTRPRSWHDMAVPEILLSGHHENIQNWKKMMGLLTTLQKRPDLLEKKLDSKTRLELKRFLDQLSETEIRMFQFQDLKESL
jgi:tRNA (guanine37-N1)-methyltransferase